MSEDELYSCMCLLMGHYPTKPVDAICVFGRAIADFEPGPRDSGIFETAARIYKENLARTIVVSKGYPESSQATPTTSYRGGAVWRNRLITLGISTDAIFSSLATNNTKEEGNNLILLAKDEGWENIIVLSNPHQGLRMMLGLVRSLKKHECEHMRIMPVFPRSVSWSKYVYGSQGNLQLMRYQHIYQEWIRIPTYQQTGDLCSFAELQQYLVRHSE